MCSFLQGNEIFYAKLLNLSAGDNNIGLVGNSFITQDGFALCTISHFCIYRFLQDFVLHWIILCGLLFHMNIFHLGWLSGTIESILRSFLLTKPLVLLHTVTNLALYAISVIPCHQQCEIDKLDKISRFILFVPVNLKDTTKWPHEGVEVEEHQCEWVVPTTVICVRSI